MGPFGECGIVAHQGLWVQPCLRRAHGAEEVRVAGFSQVLCSLLLRNMHPPVLTADLGAGISHFQMSGVEDVVVITQQLCGIIPDVSWGFGCKCEEVA